MPAILDRSSLKRVEPRDVTRQTDSNGKKSRDYWITGYLLFLAHMFVFGLSGFMMAYAIDPPQIGFMYVHGGLAILVYLLFYLAMFGVDEVKWMFINSGLGLMGIFSEIDLILSKFFGTRFEDYPVAIHVIPFLYYILYTFLLRQFFIDLARARDKPKRKRFVEALYVVLSLVVYGWLWAKG